MNQSEEVGIMDDEAAGRALGQAVAGLLGLPLEEE